MLVSIEIIALYQHFISLSKHLSMILSFYSTLALLLGNRLLLLLNDLVHLLYPAIILGNIGKHLILIIHPLLN